MPESPAPPRLITLGSLALIAPDGNVLLSADSPKLLALLAYLAARPGRRAGRDHLIDLFWADSPIEKARNSLRQSLHQLRTLLGDELGGGNSGGDIALGGAVATDRDAFLAALDSGDLDKALAIYAGPFAPGIITAGSAGFEHWADNERERLHDLFAASADTVAQRLILTGDPRAAGALAQRLLDIDVLDERAWRLRLEAEVAAGTRIHLVASIAELQRHFAEHRHQPEPRTRQLIERLTRASEHGLDEHGNPALVTDLVGREREFGQLYKGWRSAMARHALHLHITAPAGVGKTRLLDDFAFRLEAERAHVVRVRATPRQRALTGAVLAILVSALVELPGATGIADRSARILVDLQPGIATRFPNSASIDAKDADERRRMRTDALVDLLGALADEGPVCLLLDDLHWWDSYSRDIAGDALDRIAGKALLVVTASRPGPGEVTTSISSDGINLASLDRDQIAALLSSLGESSDAAAIAKLAVGLHRAADGVPLLVIGAVRLGLDRNLLCLEDSHWDFRRLDEYLSSLRPGSALAERIAVLTPQERNLLLLASVLEGSVNESTAAAGGVEAPTTRFTELERLGMLTPENGGWIAAHDLIAQIAIETASVDDVRRAHRAAGRVLLATAEAAGGFTESARHFMDGGDVADLVDVCSAWVQRCRAQDDDRAGSVVVRDLLGSHADSVLVAETIRRLPPSLRRRPWRQVVRWPTIGALGITGAAVIWYFVFVPAQSDAVAGMFVGPTDHPAQYSVSVQAAHWNRTHAALAATPAQSGDGRFPGALTRLSGHIEAAPGGGRWVFTRLVGTESDPTDLAFIDSRGVEHPLAPAPGDDVTPDWSPDGRQVVFATTRFAPSNDVDFDLAIVDITSGAVRRLTTERSSEEEPRWSPDGTRIAFIRRPATRALDQFCWISVDTKRQHCLKVSNGARAVLGWLDPLTVLVLSGSGADDIVLSTLAIDSDELAPIRAGRIDDAILSPDREWVACECNLPEAPSAPTRHIIFPVHRPGAHRSIASSPGDSTWTWFWHPSMSHAWLDAIHVVPPRGPIALDGSYRMSVTGTGSDGTRFDPPDSVLTWRSSDTTVTRVDAFSGDLRPSHPGSAWISVTAGGWRQDSIQVSIAPAAATMVFREDWTPSWPNRWHVYGPAPLPHVVSSGSLARGLTPAGNGTYADGAYTRGSYPATNGLGVEAVMQTPITEPKWQHLGLSIARVDSASESGPIGVGCVTNYTSAEGWSALHLMVVPDGVVRVADEIASGKPYRLRLQLFADGTCGVAINGRAVKRSRTPFSTERPLAVGIRGQSVGTRMMVGPLTVWRGVRADVDWSAIGGTPTAVDTTPRRAPRR